MYGLQKNNMKAEMSVNQKIALQLAVLRVKISHVCPHTRKFPQDHNLSRCIRRTSTIQWAAT